MVGSFRLSLVTACNVIGPIVLVTILTRYFAAIAILLFFGYAYFVSFYRYSARELKQLGGSSRVTLIPVLPSCASDLDAKLRSRLYSHFHESLTWLPTIRAYGETSRFLKENHDLIDLQNRALFPFVTTQRWLAVRLGLLGSTLVLVVGWVTIHHTFPRG